MALVIDSIKRNFALKLTAIFIAVLLWFTFNFLSAAQGSYTKTIELPLGVHQIAGGLVASTKVRTVSVELSGPRTQLDQSSATSLDAYVDCAGKAAGTYLLPVNIIGPNTDKIKTVTPPHVVVMIDRYAYRIVPVVARESNGSPLAANVDPKSVTVAGAQTAVVRVLAVEATVPRRMTSRLLVAEVKPIPVDAALAAVTGVITDPPTVRIIITPRKKPARR